VALFRKGVFKKTASIHASILTGTENKIFIFSKIIMLSVFIYSIFLPLQLGMIWFSDGLPVYLFRINRMIKHFNKEKIVAEKTLEKLQMLKKE